MSPEPRFVNEAPRLSASIMLLRDAPGAPEVLLLKRHQRSDVHGGVHVFPGGKVDPRDAPGSPLIDTVRAAALRELAEECGVRGLDAGQLQAHSRWITPQPSTSPKRFDTWFFVARLPAGERPHHDGHETVESLWLRPRDALQRYWLGHLLLAPPQLVNLATLARHADVAQALASAAARPAPLVQPEHALDGGTRVLAFPGDPAHSVTEQALAGPTRLVWRGGRYEPAAGLDGFFT